MKEIIKTKICIIGGGVAGMFAATTASFFKFDNILLEKNPFLGGQVTQLYPSKYVYDFPTKIKDRSKAIVDELEEQMNSYKETKVYKSIEVLDILSLENDQYKIVTDKNFDIICDFLIIASGIGMFKLNQLEIDNQPIVAENIHYTVNTHNPIYKDKKIVVLGGGDSALDWANYFVEDKITNDVSIVHRRNEYRAKPLSVEMLSKNKVKEYKDYLPVEIENNCITIEHNQTKQKEKLLYDFLIVQYGQTPSLIKIDLLEKMEKIGNKIKIDINQKTNLKNIYAIGDCTYYPCKPNTIVTACADATKVIWHIAKNKSPW
ncbi:NAD(P)/FAD-dependent oxidoreductase [Malacoplasma iowae]|uniref:NAD(P)/FAD-dependent oxidoreductase n=1 Tax=Malacoplasma iowae 695 TaxID=1048830 RepID=A0A6P1LCX5_MALIO|nr:NAD(P)/FAD-dependent oxidoreductase [Malacoplasma iowae]VEU61949.1 thioredoxin reductase [Mycoplasmopsis fermentans]EGZ31114.1 thioredoxin reductase [Malacoplasma iowae 695]QHG90047.1 NAD(P)/FAD-dependent oxidoreductase [Malacoplasma iowae 695]WPL36222.1 NAD(P)/FAD-dependent oxidoreductase [Malacoplasma iowae]WPL39470.1 NAD(P)/FAD-dependent oxidoreductase [Malacoplasma iowae]